MKTTCLLIFLLKVFLFTSCVTRNPACVKAHKNIKKMHLKNWVKAGKLLDDSRM